MKKITLMLSVLSILFGFQFFTAEKSVAGLMGPWYACYIVKGGSLQKCMGPYDNKYSCRAARYSIPFGATWLGCKQ